MDSNEEEKHAKIDEISIKAAPYVRSKSEKKDEIGHKKKIKSLQSSEDSFSESVSSFKADKNNKGEMDKIADNMEVLTEKDDSQEIEEEIEENLSISYSESIGNNNILIKSTQHSSVSNKNKNGSKEMDMDNKNLDGARCLNFNIDDDLLTGDNIAQHFKVGNKNLFNNFTNDIDSLDAVLNKKEKIITTDKSPEQLLIKSKSFNLSDNNYIQNDDVILLNDHKISINSLKNMNVINSPEHSINNESTTSDVSDLIKDDHALRSIDSSINKLSSINNNKLNLKRSKSLDNSNIHLVIVNGKKCNDLFDLSKLDDTLDEFHEDNNNNDNALIETAEIINNDTALLSNKITVGTSAPYNDDSENIDSEANLKSLKDESLISEEDISNLKEKILNAQDVIDKQKFASEVTEEVYEEECQEILTKQMDKLNEFTREVLEDISEETEHVTDLSDNTSEHTHLFDKTTSRKSNSNINLSKTIDNSKEEQEIFGTDHIPLNFEQLDQTDNNTAVKNINEYQFERNFDVNEIEDANENNLSIDSIVSLNMLQMLENKVNDLKDIIVSKDVCLAALNMQIETLSRRDSIKENRDSLKELPPSGRDSSSLATSSTDYRTIQDDFVGKLIDFQSEIIERDNLIEQLTDSLQQSMNVREQLQVQSDKLNGEVSLLRKQLADTLETIKKSNWINDQESTGQRISEISIDLVSETDEEIDKISNRRDSETKFEFDQPNIMTSLSKQVENFQRYLNPDELRIFFMVQKKFDDYLNQEINTVRNTYDDEMKVLLDRIETDKNEKDAEINRLRQLLASVKCGSTEIMELRSELENRHSQEMENLRTYFERKCADLEKHYSEEIFSQQSHQQSSEFSSDLSDQEIENNNNSIKKRSKRKIREELYASPTHRKITPTDIGQQAVINKNLSNSAVVGPFGDIFNNDKETGLNTEELKIFYKDRINEINQRHDELIKNLNEKLRRFESNYTDEKLIQNYNDDCVIDHNINTPTEQEELNIILAEFDRRLQEQVALARQDVLRELETQIQALLSENESGDSNWPPELILLREKFTAKSQLEIAQLQKNHEDEMARVKSDYDKQLVRKQKRNSTYDSSRDLDEIVLERNSLKELCSALRWILYELAKYCSTCEDDLNNTIFEQLSKHELCLNALESSKLEDNNDFNLSNLSMFSTQSQIPRVQFIPDITRLLSVVEDPSLINFLTKVKTSNTTVSFNLDECLEKLKTEALLLLELSENLTSNDKNFDGKKLTTKINGSGENEKENALKNNEKIEDLNSLPIRKSLLNTEQLLSNNENESHNTLVDNNENDSMKNINNKNVDANIQLHDLKKLLQKSEDERKSLEQDLIQSHTLHNSLINELSEAKDQIKNFAEQKELFTESFDINQLESPRHNRIITSLNVLQEKAKTIILNTPNLKNNANTLLQLIEDFCREGDQIIEEGKIEKDDLQSQQIKDLSTHHSHCCDQVDAADKQLKAIRVFLEEQAAEREQERDEFSKEIEKLFLQLKERDKDKSYYDKVAKENECMEQQIKELSSMLKDSDDLRKKNEMDLKASIEKIFVLREIISELETQVNNKSLNEHVLEEKIKEMEQYVNSQMCANEALQNEMESLKYDFDTKGLHSKKMYTDEQLKNTKISSEHNSLLDQLTEQLNEIELSIEKKTKTLEILHASICSTSCSSPSEDISVKGHQPINFSPSQSPRDMYCLQIDKVQRIMEKLTKHTRAEEAAIKRIQDLEMQVNCVRQSCNDLQHDRDLLQDRVSEQLQKISSLQSRLDEQRHRAEELHRQGTSDLNIRVHDLQLELSNLKETLLSRDKQIINLKQNLEMSKEIIDRQETELCRDSEGDRLKVHNLEKEIQSKIDDNKRLKEKIKNEMINKLALPDLMETMLADKNEEIDHLKEQLIIKDNEIKHLMPLNLNNKSINEFNDNFNKENIESKLSARTLSDIVSLSDYDEPDVIRKSNESKDCEGYFMQNTRVNMPSQMENSPNVIFPQKLNEVTVFNLAQTPLLSSIGNPDYFHEFASFSKKNAPELLPRHINFSLIDENEPRNNNIQSAFIEELFDPPVNVDNNNEQLIEANNYDRIPKLEAEVESLKISLESIKNEKELAVDKLKSELNKKINEFTDLQTEMKNLNDLYNNAIKEKNELIVEIDSLKLKISNLNDLEQILKTRESEIKDNVSKIEEMEKIITKQTSNLDALTKQLQNQNVLLDQINSHNKVVADKNECIEKLENSLKDFYTMEIKYKENLNELVNLQNNYKQLEQEIEKLNNFLHIKNIPNDISSLRNEIASLQLELVAYKHELSEKVHLYDQLENDFKNNEKLLSDKNKIIEEISNDSKILHEALSKVQMEMKKSGNILDLSKKLKDEEMKNSQLLQDIDDLKRSLQQNDNSSSPKPYSLDEIAEQVEKELNYSAQLDLNILKAIESDDLNSDVEECEKDVEELLRRSGSIDDDFKELKHNLESEVNRCKDLVKMNADLTLEIEHFKQKYYKEKENCVCLQKILDNEKQNSNSLQLEDAKIIEAMRLRLETALDHDTKMQKILEEERFKTELLSNQINNLQKIKSRESDQLLKALCDSPRRAHKINEYENDLIGQLKSEIKLLTAQNEREKERATDLQRVLDREKNRFEKELLDRQLYSDQIKTEMERILQERSELEEKLDTLQDSLKQSYKEIHILESKISSLRDPEIIKNTRNENKSMDIIGNTKEIQVIRSKQEDFDRERVKLEETITLLRDDIKRGTKRESILTENLLKEQNNNNGDGIVSELLLQRLKEMNGLLTENSKENCQMAETVHILTEERISLKNRIVELESQNNSLSRYDHEERANHLFGKYLRVESFRKALVHQKRYLLTMIATYEKNENEAFKIIHNNVQQPRKPPSFRSAVTVIIAIHRMKFIVRRWHASRRVGANAIFSRHQSQQHQSSQQQQQQQQPRKSASATTNSWTRNHLPNTVPSYYPQSPPCRDRASSNTRQLGPNPLSNNQASLQQQFRPLVSPTLITDCNQRVEKQCRYLSDE